MSEPDHPVIAYAHAVDRKPPFDFLAAVRQVIFSVGVGLITCGLAGLYFVRGLNDDDTLVGMGATLVALTMPWPGRFGRKR